MKRVYIIHRWEASPDGDWYRWLKTELEKRGFTVFILEMPDTDVPEIGKWVGKLRGVVGVPDRNTYFVGHSIGCQTILRYLETIDEPVGGAVFVAGWFNAENLENDEVRQIAKPWIETPINMKKVKSVLPKSTLIISENDPFGCFEENKRKFGEVVTKEIILLNAGHITLDDGFSELPEALDEIIFYS